MTDSGLRNPEELASGRPPFESKAEPAHFGNSQWARAQG